ncbi:hypothetical protein DRW03_16505 [Corallococcus sp. H22C18031201]|nr:hypothetical protein DRW03_16505 [Corallococcus sp. H22C18031201]
MQLRRRPWLGVLVVSLWGWGCSSSSPASPPDSGSVVPEWDGTAVPLEEVGDPVDAGTPSACRVVKDAGPGVACGDFATFDLSGCKRETLAQVSETGVFYGSVGALAFHGDAGAFADGFPADKALRDGTTLYATAEYVTLTNTRRVRVAIAACEAPTPDLVKSCRSFCVNGKLSGWDFGDLNQVGAPGSQPESSGGLQLSSESFVTQGEPVDVYVTHERAYVVSIDSLWGRGGLTVFDVRDRAHPVLKKVIHIDGDSYWNAAWSKGDTLYVASKARGVLLFDIRQPDDPQFLRALPGGEAINVHTMFVDGDILFAMVLDPVASTLIFDISNPSEPVLLDRYVTPTGPDAWPVTYTHDAFAYQGRLYVNQQGEGYVIVDVTDPSAPRKLGAYRFPDTFTHASAVGTFAGRTIAFEGGENYGAHLRVLDVTDPANIVKIGEYGLGTYSIHNMLLRGKRLYVAYYQLGLRVLDVSNPTRPREVAHYATYRDTDPYRWGDMFEGAIGIRIPGDGFVYLVDTSRGLLILNEL